MIKFSANQPTRRHPSVHDHHPPSEDRHKLSISQRLARGDCELINYTLLESNPSTAFMYSHIYSSWTGRLAHPIPPLSLSLIMPHHADDGREFIWPPPGTLPLGFDSINSPMNVSYVGRRNLTVSFVSVL